MTFEEFYNNYGFDKDEELDHEFLLSMFREPIDEKFLEENDVPDLIIDIMGTYEEEREFDLLYEFTEHLRTHNPAVFDQSFQYLHGPLIGHFLYREERKPVEGMAEDFMKKPVKVFDDMRQAFNTPTSGNTISCTAGKSPIVKAITTIPKNAPPSGDLMK